jgi:hypothetical protein
MGRVLPLPQAAEFKGVGGKMNISNYKHSFIFYVQKIINLYKTFKRKFNKNVRTPFFRINWYGEPFG